MPLYDYRCPKCLVEYEIQHGFSVPKAPLCLKCGTPLEKFIKKLPAMKMASGATRRMR